MSEASSESSTSQPKVKFSLWQRYRQQPAWKQILLLLGSALLLASAVFQVMAWIDPPQIPLQTPQGGAGGLANSFAEGSGGAPAAAGQSSDAAWSAGLFKLGFSFFAGFAIGSFVRGFLKMFMFFAGGLLVLLFVLEYAGVMHIDWSAIDHWFEGAKDRVIGDSNSLRDFISSRLPSGGSASLGLFTGFKKSR